MKYNMNAKSIWLIFKIHTGMWAIALWYAAYTIDEVRVSLLRSINTILGG